MSENYMVGFLPMKTRKEAVVPHDLWLCESFVAYSANSVSIVGRVGRAEPEGAFQLKFPSPFPARKTLTCGADVPSCLLAPKRHPEVSTAAGSCRHLAKHKAAATRKSCL